MSTDTLDREVHTEEPRTEALFNSRIPLWGSLHIMADVDDVFYPWFATAHSICEKKGITNGNKPTQWAMWDSYGCDKADWIKVIDDAALWGDLYRADPMPGVVDSLNSLREAGHVVHLVTARGTHGGHTQLIREHTVQWMFEHDIVVDALSFLRDKARIKADVAVDDGVHNVEALVHAGIPTYLVDAPHNREYSYPFRVADFNEFARIILAREQ